MREGLERLVRDHALVAFGGGIALGYALLQTANSVGTLVQELASQGDKEGAFGAYGLTLHVGHRYLTFGPLLGNLVALGLIVLAVVWVLRRSSRAT